MGTCISQPESGGGTAPEISNPIDPSSQGVALIVNQEVFDHPGIRDRFGTHVDEKSLKKCFAKFKLCPLVIKSATKDAVLLKVTEVAALDYTHCACVVVVVMTHGESGGELWARDDKYHKTQIIDPFLENASLVGKPKIFILQACRGSQESKAVSISPNSKIKSDSVMFSPATVEVPQESDLLICYSTFEGRFSYRHEVSGTVFIQTVCKILIQHGMKEDIDSIFRMIRSEVAKNDGPKQMPTTESTLTHAFCLGNFIERKQKKAKKDVSKPTKSPKPVPTSNTVARSESTQPITSTSASIFSKSTQPSTTTSASFPSKSTTDIKTTSANFPSKSTQPITTTFASFPSKSKQTFISLSASASVPSKSIQPIISPSGATPTKSTQSIATASAFVPYKSTQPATYKFTKTFTTPKNIFETEFPDLSKSNGVRFPSVLQTGSPDRNDNLQFSYSQSSSVYTNIVKTTATTSTSRK